jgi:outer membrane protein OmpA-like peptidoglycan-associated protein
VTVGVTFVTLSHADLGRTITDAEGDKMNNPNSLRGKWEKVLGADFTKSLDLSLAEKSKEVCADHEFENNLDLSSSETSKELAAEQTVAEQREKTPERMFTEMGATSTDVESPQHAAKPKPSHNSSPIPPHPLTNWRAGDQTRCDPKAQVTTPPEPGVGAVRPGYMALSELGNRDAAQKRLQRSFGVRQPVIVVAIACLTIAVTWHANQRRNAGGVRPTSTIAQAPVDSNSDSGSQPSSKTAPVPRLAPAGASNSVIAAPVLFAFDSSELDSESKKTVRAIMKQIVRAKSPAVEIHGYSDSVGDAAYNQSLSEERARAVRDYLVRIGALNNVRTKIVGHGNARRVPPAAKPDGSDDLQGHETTRRVEVIIYGSSRGAAAN